MFVLEKLIDTVAPHVCMVCGQEGTVLCHWCLPDLAPPLPDRCYRCKVQTQSSRVCKNCRRHSRLRHVWVRTGYEGGVKALIHDFKFERKQAAAGPMARLVTDCLPYLPADTIVTHVPSATSRIRRRGYDHAALLAYAVATELGLAYASVLERRGQARQVGAVRRLRLVQMQDAFRVRQSERLQDRAILLVDDIVTTGGTLEAAAVCLRQAGAKTVDAVVFAQKQ